jgi:hypothetical protein
LVLSSFAFRYETLKKRLQEEGLTPDQQEEILKEMREMDSNAMRARRRRVRITDFELLTVIGRGAFGEVLFMPFCDP